MAATALLLFPLSTTTTTTTTSVFPQRSLKISSPLLSVSFSRRSRQLCLRPSAALSARATSAAEPLVVAPSGGEGGLEISKLGISEQIVKALSRRGITELFPIQRAVLEPAMEGRDMIARAITGSGKTLAFGIPILDKIIQQQGGQPRKRQAPSALVLAPTRELARQVQQEFKESAPSLSSACLYGGIPIYSQVRSLSFGMDIVVGTPGRIIDLVERGSLDLSEVKFVVLDEADQMLAIGFQEAVESILGYLPAKKQCMLFSATMPSWINGLSRKYLSRPLVVDLVGDSDQKLADGISLYSVASTISNKPNVLPTLISRYAQGGKSIVFTKTKRDAESLSRSMSSAIGSRALHGDMAQFQRDRTLAAFREGRFNVLVATDVAARGLDIPNVDLVIHFDMPNSTDFFIHRSGRTGRAGKKGTAVLMFPESQRRAVRSIEQELGCKFEELRGITGGVGSNQQVEWSSSYESDDEFGSQRPGRSYNSNRPYGNYGRSQGSGSDRPYGNYGRSQGSSSDRSYGNYGRSQGYGTSKYSEGRSRGNNYSSRSSEPRQQGHQGYSQSRNTQPSRYNNGYGNDRQGHQGYGQTQSSRYSDNGSDRQSSSGWSSRSTSSNGYGNRTQYQKGAKDRSTSENSDYDFDHLLDLFKDEN